jgi:hypothetical protein
MAYLQSVLNDVMRAVGHVDREQFLVISVIVLALGAFFLRGFGSRTGY